MELGMVGLGRMGANLARRLAAGGHQCVVYDSVDEARTRLVEQGFQSASSLADLVAALAPPRVVWLMLPAAVVGDVVDDLSRLLEPDDVLIDGGNSYYRDDMARASRLADRRIHFVDCGTSGGVWGLERGYCLMIGGEEDIVERLDPIFRSIAPGQDTAPATPGRTSTTGTAPDGYLHCGPAGAGHFVKMVHNGIEYGMMAALAEGLAILDGADAGSRSISADAETAPLRDPDAYRYSFDLAEIAEVWRRGAVISSWLVDLTADALARDPALDSFAGRVSDSGEGRWTAIAAIEEGVPAPVITDALFQRFVTRGQGEMAARLLSAMRSEFGGHAERPA